MLCALFIPSWHGLLAFLFPEPLIHIFNSDPELLAKGAPAMRIYFFGFFMMALQFAGQSTFVGLGQSKQAVFFSLLRKVIIVVPLTLILPHVAGTWRKRRIRCRAHFQFSGRDGKLCDDALYCAQTVQGAGKGVRKAGDYEKKYKFAPAVQYFHVFDRACLSGAARCDADSA